MASKNTYINECSNYLDIMNEALKHEDYKTYDYAKGMLDEAVDEMHERHNLQKQLDTTNFGVLNHIFESVLPTLFKNNKKVVREVIKLIKEDKNLLSQFQFYNGIRQYRGKLTESINPNQYLDHLYYMVSEGIDLQTVEESNNKLKNVLMENNVVPSDYIDESYKGLYEDGNMILTHKKTVGNIMEMANAIKGVVAYMDEHKNDNVQEAKDVNSVIADFERGMKETLTESELSFVQQITDFKAPMAEQRKSKLFEKLKKDCLNKIDEMIAKDKDNAELHALKKQIEEQKFNGATIVKDIAKLLEIRDILMDD